MNQQSDSPDAEYPTMALLSLTKDRIGPSCQDDTVASIWRSNGFNSIKRRSIVGTRSMAGPDSHLSGNFFVIIYRWQLKADSAQGSLLCSPPRPPPPTPGPC